jgi:hypothetical protein
MKEHTEWCSECQDRMDLIYKLDNEWKLAFITDKEKADKIMKEIIKLCRERELCEVNHTDFGL